MTYCVYCITEIEPEVPQAAHCGVEEHLAHSYCVDSGDCAACNDADEFEREVADAIAAGNRGFGTAEEGAGQSLTATDATTATAVPDPAVEQVVEPPVVAIDPTPPTPTTDDTAATDDDLPARFKASAERLIAAMEAARAAYEAANGSIATLTGAGVAEQTVIDTLTEVEPYYQQALDACAQHGAWEAYRAYASWTPAEETIGDMDEASVSFEGYAPRLAGAQATLVAMRAVDIGDSAVLGTTTARKNVADAALGGSGYQGNNSHVLTGNLAGWTSIREEGPNVILIRWGAGRWQVGATGKHIQTSNGYDYKLDSGISTSYSTALAWKPAGGQPTLVD